MCELLLAHELYLCCDRGVCGIGAKHTIGNPSKLCMHALLYASIVVCVRFVWLVRMFAEHGIFNIDDDDDDSDAYINKWMV